MPKQKIKNQVSKKKGYRLGKALEAALNPARATYTHSASGHSVAIDTGKQEIVVDGELPILPEYLREFAFRYALENRSVTDWARMFHVAPPTVSNWLSRPNVLKYIMTLRYERRLQIVEMTTQAEGKALKKLNEILSSGQMLSLLGKKVQIASDKQSIEGVVKAISGGASPQILVDGNYYDYSAVQKVME